MCYAPQPLQQQQQQQQQQPQREHRPPPPGPFVFEDPRLTDRPGPGLRPEDYRHSTHPEIGEEALIYYRLHLDPSDGPLTRSQTRRSNPRLLRAALVADGGVAEPAGEHQAHHIVEGSNAEGQRILKQFDINPNSSVNGVFLPAVEMDETIDQTLHRGRHERGYKECVNEALRTAILGIQDPVQARAAVIDTLDRIRVLLQTEAIPLNRRVDATIDGHTLEPKTIQAFFQDAGLIH